MYQPKGKCPYCFAKLADDGFCSRPCTLGSLYRRLAEVQRQRKEIQERENSSTEPTPTPVNP